MCQEVPRKQCKQVAWPVQDFRIEQECKTITEVQCTVVQQQQICN